MTDLIIDVEWIMREERERDPEFIQLPIGEAIFQMILAFIYIKFGLFGSHCWVFRERKQ